MKYSDLMLEHFFHPKNIGYFALDEKNIGRAVVGTYENGSIIHFQIKVAQDKIVAAKFKAYGPTPIIAGCSYATLWLHNKFILEAQTLKGADLMQALTIPPLRIHCAFLVEDAIKEAIADYQNS